MLKGDKTQLFLNKLQALTLRFGATFPQNDPAKNVRGLSNVAYVLDSVQAFQNQLVKRIRVHNIGSDDYSLYATKVLTKQVNGKNVKYFSVSYMLNGEPKTTELTLNQDIGAKTGLTTEYGGIHAIKITQKEVVLSNQTTFNIATKYSIDNDDARAMIKETINEHFKREEMLFNKGFKSLSLFFIPNIKDYQNNGLYKQYFEQLYQEIRQKYYDKTNNTAYKKYLDNDYNNGKLTVDQGYFATKTGEEGEKEAIDKILNKKEQLLSFDEPIRFIFSVWALQEGWDNPNIMNICKLSNTDKETSRRQQVGRGLRLAVNQNGHRHNYQTANFDFNDFYKINTLNMLVTKQEMDFINSIQHEIQANSQSIFIDNIVDVERLQQAGLEPRLSARLLVLLEDYEIIDINGHIMQPIADFIRHNDEVAKLLPDAQQRQKLINYFDINKIDHVESAHKQIKKVKIRSNHIQQFDKLWRAINKQSEIVYKNIQETELIKIIADRFNATDIPAKEITQTIRTYDAVSDKIINEETRRLGYKTYFTTNQYHDFVNDLLIDDTFKYPLPFILQIINAIKTDKISNDPHRAKKELRRIIQESIHTHIINHISYDIIDTTILPNKLQDQNGDYLHSLDSTTLGRYIDEQSPTPEHLLYDTIVYDSDIEKQIQTNDPHTANGNNIQVFAKLPSIAIPTPYKTYNPDFAYLIQMHDKKQLFLVVESKGYANKEDIPEPEQKKIAYAKKFFDQLNKNIPDIEIQFHTRINKQQLHQIINDITKQQ